MSKSESERKSERERERESERQTRPTFGCIGNSGRYYSGACISSLANRGRRLAACL